MFYVDLFLTTMCYRGASYGSVSVCLSVCLSVTRRGVVVRSAALLVQVPDVLRGPVPDDHVRCVSVVSCRCVGQQLRRRTRHSRHGLRPHDGIIIYIL